MIQITTGGITVAPKIILPEKADIIIRTLEQAGFEAYAVGGCIRDSILGRIPNDWDITTSARPEQIKALFRRTVDTGIEHGTVTVLMDGEAFEVTTYRTDGEYKDARHPEKVEFVKNLREDLLRRDFTINAMAYNYEDGLQDPFDGCGDLERRLVKCVGAPVDRLSEDALRILRAVRFSAQLSFDIDENTKEAIRRLAPNLSRISAERICTELMKLITSDHPEYLKDAYELGITAVILPEIDKMFETPQNTKYHKYNVGDHTIKAMQSIPADKILRLTMLLHDIAKPAQRVTDQNGTDHFKGHSEAGVSMAVSVMRRLKMDNDTVKKVTLLIRYHDWRFRPTMKKVRRAMSVIGKEMFPYFLKVVTADALAKSETGMGDTLGEVEKAAKCYETVIEQGQCVSIGELAVTGKDIIGLGCEPGPAIGVLLQEALDEVIDDPEKNNRAYLMEFIKARIGVKKQNTT